MAGQDMKTLKLKDKATDGPGLPTVTVQHPDAPLGTVKAPYHRATVTTVEITEIPDDVQAASVVLAYRNTVNISFLQPHPRYSFRYDELGPGRIVR